MGCTQSANIIGSTYTALCGYDMHNKHNIGTGSFSVVKRAIRRADGQDFAIKIIDKNQLPENELEMVRHEAAILRQTDHPFIVKMVEMFETPSKIYIVLEILTGGGLFERIIEAGSFCEQQASILVKSVASAISYLHENGIAHRDLKPENLIFESIHGNSALKLTDFGLSKQYGVGELKQLMTTVCGSPSYIAPEVLSGQPYDEQVDTWSLGIILYIILCGFPPFYGEDAKHLFRAIRTGHFDFPKPYWSHISDEAKDLVCKLLVVDPTKRYTPEQVLNHPFVTNAAMMSDEPFDKNFTNRLSEFGNFWRATWEFLGRKGDGYH